MRWLSPLPLPVQPNVSLNDRLTNLLIEEWSPNIDYQKYFNECAPLLCTYIDTSYTSLFYTITVLLSLYGGLIIILRLIAISFVNVLSIFEHRPANPVSNIRTLYFLEKKRYS